MKRDFRQYVEDIIESIIKIEEYTKNLEEDEFYHNTLIQDGVVRRLEIIGEAVKHIPKHIRDKYPGTPWRKIAGLRDILSHEYFGIILENAWNVVQNYLPKLKTEIMQIRKTLL